MKKSSYEISLWKEQPSTFRRRLNSDDNIAINQTIYFKRDSKSFMQSYYKGYNKETKKYKHQLADYQTPENKNLVLNSLKYYSNVGTEGILYNLSGTLINNQLYTTVIRTKLTSSQKIKIYLNSDIEVATSSIGNNEYQIIKVSFITPDTGLFDTLKIKIESVDSASKVDWICLYKGEIENLSWIPAPDDKRVLETELDNLYTDISIIDEEKVNVLGSSESTYSGRATMIKFHPNINGSSELTFRLPGFYYDYNTNQRIKNPLINEIFEESKIKLRYKGKWRDFVVKGIAESKSKEGLFYDYRCIDSFVEELSKQGWALTFDEENGIGNIHELSEIILKDSGWEYDRDNSDFFVETKKDYERDENGNIVYDKNTNLPIEKEITVSLPKNKYDEELERYVTEYTYDGKPQDEQCWGYDTTQTITTETTRNLLTNTENFIDTVGWEPCENATIYSKLTESTDTSNRYRLIIKKSVPEGVLPIFSNDTLQSSRYSIKAGQKYAFKIEMNHSQIGLSFNKKSFDGESLFENNLTAKNNTYLIIRSAKAFSQIITTLYSLYSSDCEIHSIEFFEIKPRENSDKYINYIDKLAHGQSVNKTEFEENCLIPKDERVPQVYKEPITYYFRYNENNEIEYLDLVDKHPQKILRDNSEKVRTLKAEKSNRFNLLQDLAELFEGWARFNILHDDQTGKIYRDPTTARPVKKVSFVKEVGEIKGAGFQYKQNLSDISRERNSDELVTKMFVEKNDTELAENGTVTIEQADSSLNQSGENFLINFDYFIKTGALNAQEVINDLYGTTFSDLGYIANLGRLNKDIDNLSGTKVGLNNTIASLENQSGGLNLQISAQKERVSLLEADLGKPTTSQQKIEINEALSSYKVSISNLEASLKIVDTQLEAYIKQRDTLDTTIQDKIKEKIELNATFNTKYANFIKEGVWQDSNYLTANEYYLDAQKVLFRSSRPQVSYTMNVIDLQAIEGYEDWEFNVGDKTFVIDEELFGKDPTGAFYREEVTISEIEYDLDNPSENKITVQNFKTQFEDLFSRIAAASQTVQFKEGLYNSTANNFTPDGQIKVNILQSTLNNNSLLLAGSKDQSVIIGDKGIELTDLFNTNKNVRIVSNGIFLSRDGGKSWTTGITADGINAAVLTTGQINTDKVQIMMGNYPSFLWDKNGITSYRIFVNTDGDTPTTWADSNQFVRLDQHGLYMTKDGDSAFKELRSDNGYIPWFMNESLGSWEDRIKYVEDNSLVSLTWEGLLIKSNDGSVRISTKENNIKITDRSEIINEDGTKENKEKTRLVLGNTGASTVYYYNPNFTRINLSPDTPVPDWREGKFKDTFVTLEDLENKISDGYNIGDYYEFIGEQPIQINGETISPKDIVISSKDKILSEEKTVEDFIVSHKILSKEEINYGLVVTNDEDLTVLKTGSDGTLWLQNSFYIGEIDTLSPYFGIETAKGDLNNKVLWIAPEGNNQYVFSVDGHGHLDAKDAHLENAYVEGEIRATSGVFSGDIRSKIGNIEDVLYIGGQYEGDTVKAKSGIAANKQDEDGKYFYPYALWINYTPSYGGTGSPGEEGYIPPVSEDKNFLVTHDGKLYAKDAEIEGSIIATEGSILGKLSIGNENFLLDGTENANNRIIVKNSEGTNNFVVSNDGKVIAKDISIGSSAKIEEYLIIGETSSILNLNSSDYVIASGVFQEGQLSNILSKISHPQEENDIADNNKLLEDKSNFLLNKNGNITLKGTDNRIYGNLSINTIYSESSEEGIETQTGQLSVGNIIINQDKDGHGRIYVKNDSNLPYAWEINDNGDAKFENAYINGTLAVTRFKYNEIQTSSGTIIVRPSCEIISIEKEGTRYKISLEQELPLRENNYICIQRRAGGENQIYGSTRLYGFISEITNKDIYIDKFFSTDVVLNNIIDSSALSDAGANIQDFSLYEKGTFIDLGGNEDTGIVINSMSSDVFGYKRAITFFENKEVKDSDSNFLTYERQGRLVLGDLSSIVNFSEFVSSDSEYGLFSDNAFLKGTITTGESGITTKASNGVVIWAGGDLTKIKDNIREDLEEGAPKFYVKDDGTMRAENGYFKGTIETTDAIISGRIINNGLKVDGLSNGIIFITSEEDRDMHAPEILPGIVTSIIDKEGLDLFNGADLRIYKDIGFKDNEQKQDFIKDKIPYIFSEDTQESLNSNKLTTFYLQNIDSSIFSGGLSISKNKIEYKSEIDGQSDYLNRFRHWSSLNPSSSLIFEENRAIFVKEENEYNLETGKYVILEEGKISSLQIDSNIANISELLKLGTTVSFIPYIKDNIQDGFDIYFE